MATNDIQGATDKRPRSPNFPAFSLAKAIERAGILDEQEQGASVSPAIACEHWGVKITSSSGLRYLSTMRSFGLIDDVGEGTSKRVRLSDRAKVLLRHPDKSSSDFRNALRDAALAPRIHAEIWSKYGADGLPSDKNLAYELEMEWRFGRGVIPDLIVEMKETFALAELAPGVSIDAAKRSAAADQKREEAKSTVDMFAGLFGRRDPPPPPPRTNTMELTSFPLVGGGRLVLELPVPTPPEHLMKMVTMVSTISTTCASYIAQPAAPKPEEPGAGSTGL